MHHFLLAALGVLASCGAALAQDRPPVAPTRDVIVSYRATAPAQAGARVPQGAQDIQDFLRLVEFSGLRNL